MAERAADRPYYGDFGRAHFDETGNDWHFERDLDGANVFQALQDAQVIVAPVTQLTTFPREIEKPAGQSRRLEQQAKALVEAYPELQPACGLFPELARVSEAVEEAATHHDPRTGDLLAFGRIRDPFTSELVEIAAFPCSPTGGDLRIVQTRISSQVWNDSATATLEVPTISGQDAIWNGPGAPIRSIIFAHPTESQNEFLAVRLCAETCLFRPVLAKGTLKGSSRLKLNLALRLNTSESGGLPLAHVAFNCWAPHQFATIDEAGVWSVRVLEANRASNVKDIAHGSLTNDSDDSKRKPVDDGWARVMWVGDRATLVICNRRKLVLVHIGGGESEEIPKIATLPDDAICWNLDLAFVPGLPNYLLVLTSTHILIYHVARNDLAGLTWKCVRCLRHFYNPADISLRLHCFQEDEDILLFLRSDSNSTITVHRFDFSHVDFVIASAPTELAKPVAAENQTSTSSVASLWLHSLSATRGDNTQSLRSLLVSGDRQNKRYYSITTLHKDLAILQTLYLADAGAKKDVISSLLGDRRQKKQQRESSLEETKGSPGIRDRGVIRQQPVQQQLQHRREASTSRSESEWTVSYELTHKQLNDIENFTATDAVAALSETYDRLQTSDVGDVPPMRALRELFEGELSVHDMQEADASLDKLQHLQAVEHEVLPPTEGTEAGLRSVSLLLRPIAWNPAVRAYNGREPLSFLHRHIVNTWISPLSDDISDVIRTASAQRALHVATEVTLASMAIRHEGVPRDEGPHSESQELASNLPLRQFDVPSSLPTTPSVYYDTSSQPQSPVFTTSSQSVTPSTTASSGRDSAVAAPEIARLSRYTTFSKPPPTSLPRAFQRLMSHWIPGTDPAAYDWQATSRHFALREEEEEGEELTEREQRRRQQRMERHARRRQRHEEESQRIHMLSSQAPEIITESQPMQITEGFDVNFGTGQSQSQTGGSQILPGRYVRQPPRKKRKSGF